MKPRLIDCQVLLSVESCLALRISKFFLEFSRPWLTVSSNPSKTCRMADMCQHKLLKYNKVEYLAFLLVLECKSIQASPWTNLTIKPISPNISFAKQQFSFEKCTNKFNQDLKHIKSSYGSLISDKNNSSNINECYLQKHTKEKSIWLE